MRVLVAFLVLAAPLAGCLAPTESADVPLDPSALEALLSQPVFGGLLVENVRVASYDGVEIDNWVYRPESGPSERVPVLINFSPYWGNLAGEAGEQGDAFSKYLVEHFVPRGYAVVLSSARGTGASDGCFTIGGPGELEDMRRVVDHFAAADWSTGLVAAGGKSYDGTMPQGLLVTGHPAVKAIFPTSPISEFYKYNYVNGVPYAGTGQAFNTYYVLGVGWGVYDPDDADLVRLKDDVVCADNVDVQRAQFESMATGDYTPYWQARNYTARADAIPADVGVFYVHGLGDWNVKPDHMWPWFDAIPDDVYVLKWLGQWAHDYAHRPDLNLTHLRFFDHFLKGVDTGLLDEPRVRVQADDGVWRVEKDWPPTRAVPTTFYLAEGGLADAPGEGTVQLTDVGLPPPRGTEWVFETAPLAEDLHYAGVPAVRLELDHTATHGALSVTLYAIDGEERRVLNQGFIDYRHRASLEQGSPVVPGERFAVSFGMYPQDDVVKAGEKLALGLSFLPPDEAPVSVVPVPSFGRTTVHLGEGTHIVLPTLAPGPDLVEDPQPEDLGCWLC